MHDDFINFIEKAGSSGFLDSYRQWLETTICYYGPIAISFMGNWIE